MPKVIQAFSLIVPARYFVTIVKAVFLKGVGFGLLWNQLAYLVLFATIVFWRSVRKMNQKVA